MSGGEFDDDGEVCVIGRLPSRWEAFRVWLSDWVHPHSRFFRRNMPEDPVARELVQLLFINVSRMSDRDHAELLVDVRRRLGIRVFRKASLGYAGPDDFWEDDE